MDMTFWRIVLTVFLLGNSLIGWTATYGYVEKVLINPGDLQVKAKLDTGAMSASLDALEVTEFEIEGVKMVRFKIPTDDGSIQLTRKLIKYVRIKRRSEEKHHKTAVKSLLRPVVLMQITMGSITQALEVNLTNRGRFNYPLLLGRKALIKFNAVIDPALTFTTKLKPA